MYCIEKNEDLLSIEDMIDRANLAQKSVKRLDGSRVAFYSDEMRRQLLREKEIEAIMVKSLEDGNSSPISSQWQTSSTAAPSSGPRRSSAGNGPGMAS